MANETVDIFGIEYLSDSALVQGDYGGAGDIGEANIRSLIAMANESDLRVGQYNMRTWHAWQEGWREDDWEDSLDNGVPLDVFYITGGYGSQHVWVRNDPDDERLTDIIEAVEALEDYPVIDDDLASEVGMEWESEAWTDYVRDELVRTLDDPWEDPLIVDLEERHGEEVDDVLWEVYRAAMESTNTYPVPESDGVHIDIDRISNVFGVIARRELLLLTLPDDWRRGVERIRGTAELTNADLDAIVADTVDEVELPDGDDERDDEEYADSLREAFRQRIQPLIAGREVTLLEELEEQAARVREWLEKWPDDEHKQKEYAELMNKIVEAGG